MEDIDLQIVCRPNARKAKYEILVKEPKSGNVMWIEKKVWQDAIAARKKGNCTQEQKELLDTKSFLLKKLICLQKNSDEKILIELGKIMHKIQPQARIELLMEENIEKKY